ncbi:MAG: response regulator transcription factor [Clostridia bacterium]|nr:response regulator transcription factor [Clostridia bacterium]
MKVSDRTLLFIEDDFALAESLITYFEAENSVYHADTLAAAKKYISVKNFDAIVTDVILPDGTGLDIFKCFSEASPPILVLSSLGNDEHILEGLESGAVDYIVKPCSAKLLEGRIAIRLLPKSAGETLQNGLRVNAVKRTVHYNGKPIQFTSSEFNVLYYLITHPGQFFSSNELYEAIWRTPALNTTTIRKHISSMRRKLLEGTGGKELILTDFGKGYAFAGGNS